MSKNMYQKREERKNKKIENDNNQEMFHKTNINWYPGHMSKTLKQIEEDLKFVDIVIEILDARIPKSSQNPQIKKILGDKKKIVILNKSDLADNKENKKWINSFLEKNITAILCNSNSGDGVKKAIDKIDNLLQEEKEKSLKKGRTGKIIRAMIIGVPNVGKSSFINRASNRTTMQVGNKPGITKQKQWLHLSNNIDLLDTPGVLWPKLDTEETALNLAYTGNIKSEILEETEIAYNLVKYLLKEHFQNLIQRYNLKEEIVHKILEDDSLEENEKIVEVMNYIAEKRGSVIKGNTVDLVKISKIILDDFKNGNLGKITLEKAK